MADYSIIVQAIDSVGEKITTLQDIHSFSNSLLIILVVILGLYFFSKMIFK